MNEMISSSLMWLDEKDLLGCRFGGRERGRGGREVSTGSVARPRPISVQMVRGVVLPFASCLVESTNLSEDLVKVR